MNMDHSILELMLRFLDLSCRWKIGGDELKQFLSAKTGEAMAGPSFRMKEIEFTLYLTPNGLNESEEGFVQFLAAPSFCSSEIESVTLWYSLYCRQSESEWSNTTTFNSEDNDCESEDNDCASWPVHTLPLRALLEEERLEFLCFVDILSIDYLDPKPSFFGANTEMNRYAKFQWNIYDELLDEFRYCVWGRYFIENINANWMLECAPNGQCSEDEGNVNVLLSLLRLPNQIKAVTVHMILECDHDDIKWDFTAKFDYDCNSFGWPEYTLLASNLLVATSISFTVEMTIQQIYDEHGRCIPQKRWTEYGIVQNHEELHKQFDLDFKRRHKAKLLRQQRMIRMKECNVNVDHVYNQKKRRPSHSQEEVCFVLVSLYIINMN